jgi:hypothetical protein
MNALAVAEGVLDGFPSSEQLLKLAEKILEDWIAARGEQPTHETSEGFRLLALHRQGARGVPSFNACRETCREIVFHRNLLFNPEQNSDREEKQNHMMMTMLVRHLALFVYGKMEVEGLGEFCCSSRSLRLESPAEKTEDLRHG